ncbi:MAG TPA: protein phosphatase 2C domain-containing protein [Gemmataceae bacterium]|nr:protein phosphatase 2C domain-containing protein [Gemmataceae bacterium]
MIRVAMHSEPGGHPANEDAFGLRPHPDDPSSYLCAVADGQGGHFGGGPAARLACDIFLKVAAQATLAELSSFPVWDDILAFVDRAVVDDPHAGFTTLVAFCIAGGRLTGASCGDSALVFAEPEQERLVLTSRQSKDPPVGSGGAVFIPFSIKLHAPWAALAMTDGVWKYAGWDAVLQAAAGPAGEDAIRSLRQRAGLPGTGALQDDFTLVILCGDEG